MCGSSTRLCRLICGTSTAISSFIPFAESLLIALMIASTSTRPASAISRALENRQLRFLGVISYSLYVWQQLFLMPRSGGLFALLLLLAALGSWSLIRAAM